MKNVFWDTKQGINLLNFELGKGTVVPRGGGTPIVEYTGMCYV